MKEACQDLFGIISGGLADLHIKLFDLTLQLRYWTQIEKLGDAKEAVRILIKVAVKWATSLLEVLGVPITWHGLLIDCLSGMWH